MCCVSPGFLAKVRNNLSDCLRVDDILGHRKHDYCQKIQGVCSLWRKITSAPKHAQTQLFLFGRLGAHKSIGLKIIRIQGCQTIIDQATQVRSHNWYDDIRGWLSLWLLRLNLHKDAEIPATYHKHHGHHRNPRESRLNLPPGQPITLRIILLLPSMVQLLQLFLLNPTLAP